MATLCSYKVEILLKDKKQQINDRLGSLEKRREEIKEQAECRMKESLTELRAIRAIEDEQLLAQETDEMNPDLRKKAATEIETGIQLQLEVVALAEEFIKAHSQ